MVVKRDKQTFTTFKRNPRGMEGAFSYLPQVYQELYSIAQKHLLREKPGHTLLPGDLVHETFMRMIKQDRVVWKGKTHFLAVSAEAMRRILIDKARARNRLKRGGNWTRVILDDVIAIEKLDNIDQEQLQIILKKLTIENPYFSTIVHLRFFTGLTVAEVADLIGVSKRKIESDWTRTKKWLKQELQASGYMPDSKHEGPHYSESEEANVDIRYSNQAGTG